MYHFVLRRTLLTIAMLAFCAMPPTGYAGELSVRLLADLQDRRLDDYSLLDAALIAGGVDDQLVLENYRKRISVVADQLRRECANVHDPLQKTDVVFRALHRELLTGEYRLEDSQLSRTFELGHYNCVSATIMFHVLAKCVDLPITAVAAKGHVLSCVSPATPLWIETTCRDWTTSTALNPKTQAEIAGRLESPRFINECQLLGKLFYNLGVSWLEGGQFEKATESLKTSVLLDEDDAAAKENLLATLNNWSLQICDQGDYRTAATRLSEGMTIDSKYQPFLANDLHIHQKWIKTLCDEHRFSEAAALVELCYSRRPDADLYGRGRWAVHVLWARTLFRQDRHADGWQILDEARAKFGTGPDYDRYEKQTLRQLTDELSASSRFDAARKLLSEAIVREPNSADLQQLLKIVPPADLPKGGS